MFHYNGPNCDLYPEECPSGLHWYYDYASDNEFEHETISSITDTDTSCILRPNAGGNRRDWIGLNNFVSPPSQDAAQILNAYNASKRYVEDCSSFLGTDINFVIVDFWNEGEMLRMTQDYNKARALQQSGGRNLLRTHRQH